MAAWWKREGREGTDGVELPKDRVAEIQDSYKYLGIPQANGDHDEDKRRSVTTKYLQRVRQVPTTCMPH